MKTKSIRIYEQGSYDVLKVEETNIPILKSNEVLIKHHYLGLNYIDCLLYTSPSPRDDR